MSYTVRKDRGLMMNFEAFVWEGILGELFDKYVGEGLLSLDIINVSQMGEPVAVIWFSDWEGRIVMDTKANDTIIPELEEDAVTEEDIWDEEIREDIYPNYMPDPDGGEYDRWLEEELEADRVLKEWNEMHSWDSYTIIENVTTVKLWDEAFDS